MISRSFGHSKYVALRTFHYYTFQIIITLFTVGKGHVSLNLALQWTFSLFVNMQPCVSIKGYRMLYDNVNTVLIHENTEGEYSGIEHEVHNENQSLDFSHDHTPRWSMVLYSLSSSSPTKHLSALHNMLSTMCRPRTDPKSQWCTKPTSC